MLRRHVCVHDDRGQAHQFGPGDDVPAWARKKITNPRAWVEQPGGGQTARASATGAQTAGEAAGDDAPAARKAPARRSRAKKVADPDAGDGQ